MNSDKGKAARKRLTTKYSLKERESKLIKEIISTSEEKYRMIRSYNTKISGEK